MLKGKKGRRYSFPAFKKNNDRLYPSGTFLLLFFLALSSFFLSSQVIPPWMGNDEPMHYQYVEVINRGFKPPLLVNPLRTAPWWKKVPEVVYAEIEQEISTSMVKFNFWTINELRQPTWNKRFSAIYPGATAMQQAPLYYLIAAGLINTCSVEGVSDGLFICRLLTIFLWTMTVLLTAIISRHVLGPDNALAILAPLMVILFPMTSSNAGVVNNDALAIFLSTFTVLLMIRSLSRGVHWKDCALIGLVILIALMSKRTAISLIPLFLVCKLISMLSQYWVNVLHRLMLMLVMLSMISIVLIYLVPTENTVNINEYVGQRDDPASLETFLNLNKQHEFFLFFFRSFWGTFVWGHHFMSPYLYQMILLFCVICAISFFWQGLNSHMDRGNPQKTRSDLNVELLLSAGIFIQLTLIYTRFFTQIPVWTLAQGRFMFNMISPITVLLVVGLNSFIPKHKRQIALIISAFVLLLFHTFTLINYTLPHYYMYYY